MDARCGRQRALHVGFTRCRVPFNLRTLGTSNLDIFLKEFEATMPGRNFGSAARSATMRAVGIVGIDAGRGGIDVVDGRSCARRLGSVTHRLGRNAVVCLNQREL
jgi:hypothetical protein